MASKRTFIILSAVLTAIIAAGAQTAAPPYAQLRAAWIANLQAHKLDQSLTLYAPDATFLSPDGTHADGTRRIRALFETVFAAYDAKIILTSRATATSGDLAFDSGTFAENITDRSTHAAQTLHGDYLTVYRHFPDGQWRIVQQAWTGPPPK